MKPFIEYICDILLEHIAAGKDPILVLPNKRPVAYMQKYMAHKMKKALWFPKIYTIEDFVIHISKLQLASPLHTANCLYQIYTEALQDQADAFDDFIKWWSLVIADFNDIDMYMVDANQLFNYITEAKAIEQWNPGADEPTKLQQHYLSFWKYLPLFYNQLEAALSKDNMGYRGMLYKKAVAVLNEGGYPLQTNPVIFAGFNALSTSEEKIIEHFLQTKNAAVYWEADDYYVSDEKQEAGKFLRHYKSKWQNYAGSVFYTNNLLLNEAKEITITGAPKSIMQSSLAGSLVKQLLEEKSTNSALIPADENLLSPLLYNLPGTLENEINVSMGYPVHRLPLNGLYVIVFDFISQLEKDKQAVFSTNQIHLLFSHVYAPFLFCNKSIYVSTTEIKKAGNAIIKSGKTHNTLKEISALNKQFPELNFYWFFESLVELFGKSHLIPAFLQKLNEKLSQPALQEVQTKEILGVQLQLYQDILVDIGNIFYNTESTFIKQAKTLLSLINQSLASLSLPFIGNATGGLQFIGLLETRMLQFDELIITGCNEGILPNAKATGNSFIPYDIRHQFNLPTYKDSEAVFAYHFYRLLQGAKKVNLIYNTETDEFGSGEKSRFLVQLEMELAGKNPNAKITSTIVKLPALANFSRKAISFNHTDAIDESIKLVCGKGLSATALISYKNCSLQFYFKYLERIKEPDEIAKEVEANIVGSVIHAVLEELYAPLKNQNLTIQQLQFSFEALENLTRKAFEKIEPGADSMSGKNLLFIQTAVRIIANFLVEEQKALKAGVKLRVMYTEQQFDCNLSTDNEVVKLRGTIDRIDEWDNKIRIIDYKTGSVDRTKLKPHSVEELFEDPAYDKAFQLLFYMLLYQKNFPDAHSEVEAGILSLRKISDGLYSISTKEDVKEILKSFEENLIMLINQLLNREIAFTQTANLDICSYCAYLNICMR